ncbi:ABC transporter permease [Acrocarpospora corrugata]|uniref:ABC transporter permease n=1 Tax=Acrocarpospora corrugata TaxID=35763 RepID=A0A5M3W379_9ACTN|nr:ABC transporter permease [Acrocarpospora corrugata]GES02690.1 ABC transporter permease [Acrocarpospora corrugata]
MSTRARLLGRDLVRLGSAGLRARPGRTVLAALGIAIGIAAMACVVGVAASSQESLNRRLDALGTNLLTIAPGQTLEGESAHLPADSIAMIGRIGPVTSVTATATLEADVYRSDLVPGGETGSLAVLAARTDLMVAVRAGLARGAWLNAATERFPVVVLGATAAKRLGVLKPGERVWLGGQWFSVAGVLRPVALAPELDVAALIGWPAARTYLRFDGRPTVVYTRTRDDAVEVVRAVLAATANPEAPNEVRVSRPSEALTAKRAATSTLTALLLGLGAVALLVGGVGVANTMVVSVLERRPEIGLRRSLGATRRHVRLQFLAESLLLSAAGGAAGILLGAAVTAGYAFTQGWPVVVPAWAVLAGLAATLVIGAAAGVYPAWRAATTSPVEALH